MKKIATLIAIFFIISFIFQAQSYAKSIYKINVSGIYEINKIIQKAKSDDFYYPKGLTALKIKSQSAIKVNRVQILWATIAATATLYGTIKKIYSLNSILEFPFAIMKVSGLGVLGWAFGSSLISHYSDFHKISEQDLVDDYNAMEPISRMILIETSNTTKAND